MVSPIFFNLKALLRDNDGLYNPLTQGWLVIYRGAKRMFFFGRKFLHFEGTAAVALAREVEKERKALWSVHPAGFL